MRSILRQLLSDETRATLSTSDNAAYVRAVAIDLPPTKLLRSGIHTGTIGPLGMRKLFDRVYSAVDTPDQKFDACAFVPLIVAMEPWRDDFAEEMLLLFARINSPQYRLVRDIARLSLQHRTALLASRRAAKSKTHAYQSMFPQRKNVRMRVYKKGPCDA